MPNTFDSVPSALTQKALSGNFSVEEKGRREQMLLNRDFYYGKQESELTLVNEDVEPYIMNLTKPIVKKRATLLYSKPVQREWTGPSQSISFIEQVFKDNDIDAFLSQVDLGSELTGTVLVHPELVPVDEKYQSGIKLRMYDASSISVIPKEADPNLPDAISLIRLVDRLARTSTPQNPQVERVIRQQIWTEQSVVTYDGQLLISSETNELDFLPFVNFKGEEVYDQFLGHAPATLIRKLNKDVNQLLTELGYTIRMQSATPIALAGYSSGEGVTIHPGRAFSLPVGAAAQVLQTNPKILEVLNVLQYLEEKMFETSSVPKVCVVGGEGESGRELLVRWFPILQVFNEKAIRFEKTELRLANLILKMVGLPPLEELNCNYPENDLLPLSSSEDTLEQDIRLNLKTPIDELMRRNPEFTEVEAEAELLANKEVNDNLFSRQEPEQEEEQEEEDTNTGEQNGNNEPS